MNSELQNIIKISKDLKLLYVEDNQHTREATKELLYSFFNDVVIATDGMEAWQSYQKEEFDFIFTDISMPKMDGIELIENIRKEDSNIPIVVLSAYNDNRYLLQAIKLGVDGYIIKPLELEQFLTILKKVIRKYQLEQKEKEARVLYERIGESIKFASVLQHALLPPQSSFENSFKDYFSIWQPRDIVGGDFYFLTNFDEDRHLVAVIDCTGHGVHGAFLAMLCEMIYRQIVLDIENSESKRVSPAKILTHFNRMLTDLFYQKSSVRLEGKGFDGQFVYIDKKKNKVRYAGAKNPLYYSVGDQILSIKADNRSIGYNIEDDFKFTEFIVDIEEGMKLYIATDGFWDQLGGEKSLPYGKARFEKMLAKHKDKPMSEQKQIFLATLRNYQAQSGSNQVDDIAFIGIDLGER